MKLKLFFRSAVLFLAASAFNLVSCTSEKIEEPSPEDQQETTDGYIVVTDGFEGRVINFEYNSMIYGLSRAGEQQIAANYEMPTDNFKYPNLSQVPTVPYDASNLQPDVKNTQAYRNYVLYEGVSVVSDNFNFNNSTYYIKGSLELTNWYGGPGKIVVLPGGTLKLSVSSMQPGWEIENYGTLILPNEFNMNDSRGSEKPASIKTVGSITMTGKFNALGNLEVAGDINVGELYLGSEAKPTTSIIGGNVTVKGDSQIQAETHVGGNWTAASLNVTSQNYGGKPSTNVYILGSVTTVTGNTSKPYRFDVANGSHVDIGKGLTAPTIKISEPNTIVRTFYRVHIADDLYINDHGLLRSYGWIESNTKTKLDHCGRIEIMGVTRKNVWITHKSSLV